MLVPVGRVDFGVNSVGALSASFAPPPAAFT